MLRVFLLRRNPTKIYQQRKLQFSQFDQIKMAKRLLYCASGVGGFCFGACVGYGVAEWFMREPYDARIDE